MVEDKASTDFEVLLRKIAVDLTSGVFFERMAPMAIWERVEKPISVLLESAAALREEAISLKPERYHTINHLYEAMVQKLNTFREILFQRTTEPLTNSRLGLEQLRLALGEASDFLQVLKEARADPNPLIKAILDLRMKQKDTHESNLRGVGPSQTAEQFKEDETNSEKKNDSSNP